jgi:hypothetical protein
MNKLLVTLSVLAITSSYWCEARADPLANFDMLLSGDAFFTSGVVHQNTDAGARNVEFMNRFRLTVTPTAVADNGVSYGARLRVRASLGSGEIDGDQAYIFARGGFGTVEAGTVLNPALSAHVIAPTNFGTGGVDGDWAIGDNGWIQNQVTFLEPYFGGGYTITTFVKSANRINYVTPRLFSGGDDAHGLIGTASYAPANRSVFTNVDRALINTNAVGEHPIGTGHTKAFSDCLVEGGVLGCDYHNIYEATLRDDETLGGVTITSGAAYIGGSSREINFGTPQSFYDLSAWQAGIQLGMDGILVGGSYLNAGRSAYPHQSMATGKLYLNDQFTWTAGVSYTTGPVSVGFNYQYGHDAGDLTVPGARTANLYAVGVTYWLAPGLSTALESLRSATHNEAGFVSDALGIGPAESGNATIFLWKTQVRF